MTEERKYIYSIIRKPPREQALGSFDSSGINDRSIIFISYRDIAAAVSNIHLINFDRLDKKELTSLVAVHERVNFNLMKKHDVIPMRFGMMAENQEEILNILAKAYIQFKTALERIAGKAEFVVHIFWDEKKAIAKIVQENPEIKKLKKETESRGRILGVASRMKLGKRTFEAMESRRKEYTADILGNLTARFPDFSAGKLLDTNNESVSSGTDKKMIINHSFLVGKTKESALESQLNELAEKYKDELKFKYIGPMPPYSFVNINLRPGNFEVVNAARNLLGLGEEASLMEIKKAYYALAHQYHPDKHQANSEKVQEKMKQIIQAYHLLKNYCQSSGRLPDGDENQKFSFKEEMVKETLIFK